MADELDEEEDVMLPNNKAPDWTNQTFAERIHNCRMMLRLHDFLTATESEKVRQRQLKRGFIPEDAVVIRKD